MIEAAKTEGEVAGVMAHELSHVALRHGTAQATKATKYAIGQMAGAVLGAIIGGTRRQRRVARHPVRARHGIPAIQPRVRASGRPARVAHHGARRLRPARHGEHVQDDRAAGGRGRAAVAERSPESRGTATSTSPAKRRCSASRTRCATRARSTARRRGSARWRRRRRPRRRRRAAPAEAPRPAPPITPRHDARRAAVVTQHDLQRGEPVPDRGPLELARAAGQQRRHVRAGGCVRHDQPAEHLHARRRGGHCPQRDARPADRDRRVDRLAGAGEPAARARRRIHPREHRRHDGPATTLANMSMRRAEPNRSRSTPRRCGTGRCST